MRIPAGIFEELELAPGNEIRILLSNDPDFLQAVRMAIVSSDGAEEKPESGEETGGFLLTDDILNAAGFLPGGPLEIICGNREIEITVQGKAPARTDPLDRLPKGLHELCDDLGLDPDAVRRVMEEGAYFK